ncbi:type II toxin-antitoxin system PemK/MazF family toxin [Peptostreptococcus equinus]|uniref:Type II toxin-antitoxin system PemK/MazF family toxin n=1 Tax=Peptostreptococcus equinus TaxID=3003601 RepID=A0ABY7JPF7_9FIRM|nr:type II toxin-antitoxin system PemK/MazF family toxin [Peptostreptococcus sp. CBA3647]WAW14369.1 type II toxin-antitoxin system PemK/MazF family toxin [Peptostreptococcus sp. CBA3647]
MGIEIYGVYLVDFKQNVGGEISGKHYALVLSKIASKDKTLLVAPITSKKTGTKYRGGLTIDCTKYQTNPTYNKAFIKVRKIREVDKSRVIKKQIYKLDSDDIKRFEEYFKYFFRLE